MSKTPLDLLMWAHYSECHKGICLGFDSDILSKEFGQYYSVQYVDTIPNINIFSDSTVAINQFFCTKSNHWSYEQEVRYIKYRPSSSTFPKEALRHVIFGLNCPVEDQLKLLKEFLDNGYEHLEFYKTIVEKGYYKLSLQKIPLFKDVGF